MEGGKEKERARSFSVLELATNQLAWSVSCEDEGYLQPPAGLLPGCF